MRMAITEGLFYLEHLPAEYKLNILNVDSSATLPNSSSPCLRASPFLLGVPATSCCAAADR